MFLPRISANYQVFVIVQYLMYGDGDSRHDGRNLMLISSMGTRERCNKPIRL